MDFTFSSRSATLLAQMSRFMDEEIYPREDAARAWFTDPARLWQPWPVIEELKEKAQSQGLWNLFLPHEYEPYGAGLANVEYAPLAEMMGRVEWASEVFNCSAPDTGNMEVLARFGTPVQRERWLEPLLSGKIRSAYLMTEPQVASSDATNLETSIVRDGDDYVVNGRKWWITGILDPRCEILLVMGKTDFDASRHAQHSIILIPRHTSGVSIVRSQTVLGNHRSPIGEAEVLLENVRVPAENLILGEGRGFEIAQARLGPGRIHHCMRSIGQAQRSLELMASRVENRKAFGKKLSEQGSIRQEVAKSYCEIEMARLLTLKAADAIDRAGAKSARDLIAAIKIVVPQMAQTVVDRAIQAHGGLGLSGDTPLADFFVLSRLVRLTDGPEEVHMAQLGRMKINELAVA